MTGGTNGGGGTSWGKLVVSQLPWVIATLVAGLLAFTRLESRYDTMSYRLAVVEGKMDRLQEQADQGVRQELERLRAELRKMRVEP